MALWALCADSVSGREAADMGADAAVAAAAGCVREGTRGKRNSPPASRLGTRPIYCWACVLLSRTRCALASARAAFGH